MGYPYVTPISITSNESYLMNESLNLKRKVIYKDAQRWELLITLKDAGKSKLFSDLMGHWMRTGLHTSFDIPVPQHLGTEIGFVKNDIYGNIGAPTVSDEGEVGDSSINISHFLARSYPAGRFITFGNHHKLYAVTESFDTLAENGSAEMRVFPSLRQRVPANTPVNFFDVVAKVFNEADSSSFQYTDGIMQNATLKIVEDV